VNVAVKLAVLTNGNDAKVDKKAMQGALRTLLVDWLQMNSGFDANSESDDDIFRFKGAFDLIGHLANAFGRREICLKDDNEHLAMLFGAINQAQTLKTLCSKKQALSKANFALLCSVLAMLPIKTEKLPAELSEVVKDGLMLVQKSYLDHSDLNSQCSDAVLNMAQLTYDNFQDSKA